MRRTSLLASILFNFCLAASAQMQIGADTLYGNEWINYDQTYFKTLVAQDGMYRIPAANLPSAFVGLDPQGLRMYHFGKEVPIYVYPSGDIDFFGVSNRGELDRFLYANPEDQFNPHYSLFTDSSAYFLTWAQGQGLRYEEVENDLVDLPEKEGYYWEEYLLQFNNTSFKKYVRVGSWDIRESYYRDTEGFGRTMNNDSVITFSLSFPYLTGPAAEAKIKIINTNLSTVNKTVRLNNNPIASSTFSGFQSKDISFPIQNTLFSSPLSFKVQGTPTVISEIIVNYPRLFNADNQAVFAFSIGADSEEKKYLEIENFAHQDIPPILYYVDEGKWMETVLENGLVKIALPPSDEERRFVLTHPEQGGTSLALEPVTFIPLSDSNAQMLLLYHAHLASEFDGKNWVEEYAQYRRNSAYNPLSTLAIDIQQVYDQFSYGIHRHPMAVKNLSFFAIENWPDIKYLLLAGKAREYKDVRRTKNLPNVGFFIPTFGFPGGDIPLVSKIGSANPEIAVGRLPFTNPGELKKYIEKIIAYEAAPSLAPQTIADKAWMKHILHLSGGLNTTEISTIRSNLAGMEQIIKNNRFGAEVTTFSKTSSDPVQTSATQGIINRINEGIALITYFGHSSSTLLDFNFDDPDSYNNEGKYPVILSFGCFSGNMYQGVKSLGERFLIAEKKGAIGFISTSNQGFSSSLNIFGRDFYARQGGNQYGASIGEICANTTQLLNNSSFLGDRVLAQQTSIQGDPSIRIYHSQGPDYLPDQPSFSLEPSIINSLTDSFSIALQIRNIGRHIPDTSFAIQIMLQSPNGETHTLKTDSIQAPASVAQYTAKLPLWGEQKVGMNRVMLKIDAFNQIEEKPDLIAEENNDLIGPDHLPGFPFFVNSFEAIPLYPANFSIVNYTDIELKASTGYVFDPSNTYWMEIDTTEDFDSALKQSVQLVQKGGILRWKPGIAWSPNTVYYWRVSPDMIPGQSGFAWRNNSFIFLPNSGPGWNQSHYYQLQYDEFLDMKLPDTRKLAFIDNFVDFKIRNNARDVGYDPRYLRGSQIELVDSWARYTGQIPRGVYFSVIDTLSAKAIQLSNTGAAAAPNSKGFFFRTDTPTQRAQVVNFLNEMVPDGHYVIMYTCQNGVGADYKPQEWEGDSPSIFDVLEAQGADTIRNLATIGSRPYNLFYRKNRQTEFPTSEIIGDFGMMTELNIPVPGAWTEGSITSPPIGPAQEWETLDWELSGWNPSNDQISFKVWGLPVQGPDTLLYEVAQKTFSLKEIDAAKFPRIKLEYYAKDPTQKSPPHLEYWRVHYVGIPEAALDPNTHFSLLSDTIQQGAPLLLEIATENLSDYDMDSLLVRYTIVNTQNQASLVEKRYRPLPARDTLIAHLQFDTRHATGLHQLIIDVNPDDDQPEQTHINNVGQLQFFVQRDQRNPLLDVTFDGMRIMDGDLVSSKPFIQVQLKDENPYLALEDTSLFRLLLVHPGGMEERLYFTDERIRFYPAEIHNGKNNRARVEFEPVFAEDGLYDFYIEASDATGNKTGDINHVVSLPTFGYDYKISFKVIAESMISKVLNYPNPFSTSTRFLYTLTGDEPPAYFTIQILTVSGRVVREITQNEIGPMKIGTHLTEYAWDGRDDFGDPLANGVYLYRVVAKKANGENFKAYASGADSFFEKGYGKMVIIR